jgi:hypothetical protein
VNHPPIWQPLLAAEERLDVELVAERVPQILSAAVVDPRKQFVCGESERNCVVKKIERRRLLFEVALGRMIHVGDAGPYRVEGFERAHQCAGRKNLDLDAAAGRIADRLREANRAGLKARRTFRPIGHHLQLSDSLCDRGRWEAQGSTRGRAGHPDQQTPAVHDPFLCP